MGTRADFYIRKDKDMEWLGSIGWDGYPGGIDKTVVYAATEEGFRRCVDHFFSQRKDVTLPDRGWPWPWEDSRTTDYAYIFEKDRVMASCFGYPLFDPVEALRKEEDDSEAESEEGEDEVKMEGYFPNMKDRQNIRYDNGSGALFIGIAK